MNLHLPYIFNQPLQKNKNQTVTALNLFGAIFFIIFISYNAT
ncbi:hypothetical protein FDUTEX481_00989 [Tolypothrix sp. PCC 7601]|nr:hypothetical protein FDUTEX481_00989 [Tolypothrix sp. PCC 7601]